MRKLAFLCFLSAAFLLSACAEPNPDAGTHPLDGSYLAGSQHGPVAKQDLTFCQGCHGEVGGPGSNPLFNIGIDSAGGDGCESCHGANLAHPQDWAGANSTFHYSAGSIQEACTLCHGVALDGVGGVGPSCLQCHDSVAAFTLDCTSCHDYPPDGIDHDGVTGVAHSAVTVGFHSFDCDHCHGMTQTAAGGGFEPVTNYTLFNKGTDTIGDHWDGNIHMNGEVGYNDTNFGCDTAGCHSNDPPFRLSDSELPVILKDFGF